MNQTLDQLKEKLGGADSLPPYGHLPVTIPGTVDGWFEMQDEASQLVAEVTAPPPGGKVLDACAGAGGKTLALAFALVFMVFALAAGSALESVPVD